jgi:hypothetical protein
MIDVSEITWKLAAGTAPNETADARVKLDPVMSTEAPPRVRPDAGVSPVTTGGGSITCDGM